MQTMPPIGAEIPCSILAIGATLEYNGATLALDFRGGIKHRVDVNPYDPTNSVVLRTVGFKASAEGPDGMTVTFERTETDDDPKSLLRRIQQYPPRFEHIDVENLTLTIDTPGAEPVILTTKNLMKQVSHLTQFPPRGDTYKLQDTVEFVGPKKPDTVVARLTAFDSKRGGL